MPEGIYQSSQANLIISLDNINLYVAHHQPTENETFFLQQLHQEISEFVKEIDALVFNAAKKNDIAEMFTAFAHIYRVCNKGIKKIISAIPPEIMKSEHESYSLLLKNIIDAGKTTIAENLDSLSKIKAKKTFARDFIYDWCLLLNGNYKIFQQFLNPLIGAAGYCGLYTELWLKNNKMPYPQFNSDLFSYDKAHPSNPMWEAYYPNKKGSIETVFNCLEDIELNKNYKIRLHGQHVNHLLGIKRVNGGKGVQLFDPSWGEFTFASEHEFKAWFAALLLEYFLNGFFYSKYTLHEINKIPENNLIPAQQTSVSLFHCGYLMKFFDIKFKDFDNYKQGIQNNAALVKNTATYLEVELLMLNAFSQMVQLVRDQETFMAINNYLKKLQKANALAFSKVGSELLEADDTQTKLYRPTFGSNLENQ